ncbi:hypothetical protein [Acidovorax sp. SUPP2825]|uniref:hypothetical protein n=1 Tax=Acidovorax sp. SUPP2825 TaxID=2920879 RepID=UPI0023DE691F|nr:hypothetical protein [Acidovorax sp. SUPP2825]GKS93218.1 hypothetical protein AVAK2825_01805 [Acidovorax sp. SUPP2825]
MMKKNKRLSIWLFFALALTTFVWYASKPAFKGEEISPMKVYRLEYYDASLIQRAIHYQMKTPSLVRLYRIQPETLLGESAIVDLWMNGTPYWWTDPPANAVVVGSSVVFENIPPE